MLSVIFGCWGTIYEGDFTWMSYAWSAKEGRGRGAGGLSIGFYRITKWEGRGKSHFHFEKTERFAFRHHTGLPAPD